MTLTYQAAAFSDRGPRETNQDVTEANAVRGYVVVADGMGGAAGGAVASSETVAAVHEVLDRAAIGRGSDDLRSLLLDVCREANRRVYARAATQPGLLGMGSTLALVVAAGGAYCAANVGDSRVYLLRHGGLTQLSHDHSLVQERVDAGIISEDEALLQPDRNVITRAIGVADTAEPHIAAGRTEPGDRFLVTSDGVHGVLAEADLASGSASETPAQTAERLVRAALERGSTDNASAAVLRVIGSAASRDNLSPRWSRLVNWLRSG